MKFKTLVVLALAVAVPALACAKKPKKVSEEEVVKAAEEVDDDDEPTITEECVMNVSLFHEAVKNKMYADAYEPWWDVYKNCPNANKSIYSDGAKIVEALYQATSDKEEKERLAKLAIEMQDKRIKYFGKDPKYPKAYIRKCLRESAEGMGIKSKMAVLKALVDVSYSLYKANPDDKAEDLIGDYELASGLLADQAADPNNKNAELAGKQKDYVDNIFAISGAADCKKLDDLYEDDVEDNKNNLDVLQKIVKLYKRVRCTESDVYFAACEAAHKLQPTDESAAGCASMAAKKGDYEAAVKYYDQAIQLATVEEEYEDVADYQYNAAVYCYSNLKRYPEARRYAQASIATLTNLGMTKGQGRCYIIIGMAYAATRLYGNDPKGTILNKTVYWAAVDKFVKAKQIDPSVEAAANDCISTYAKYFPTKEERFDLPNEFSGSTYYVGGWIGETTTIR